jgi:hypothetical protein
MKNLTIRPLAVLALLAMLGLSVPAMAVAETPTTTTTVAPTTTTTVTSTTTTTPQTCKQQLRQWVRQLTRHHEASRGIYTHFSRTYERALDRLATQLRRARNPADLTAALGIFHITVNEAKADRDAALAKLGPAPTQPTC